MSVQSTDKTKQHRSAMEWMTRGLGILVGFFSFEHGLLEALQGNTVPVKGPVGFDIKMLGFGYVIDAIGQDWKFWPGASEPAFTIVPNYLITGIAAMAVGVIIVLWVLFMMNSKFGVLGFVGLTVLLFFFGGGFAPIFTSIYTVICALLQNKEHRWWKTHIPLKTARIIGRFWPWLFVFTLDIIGNNFIKRVGVAKWLVQPDGGNPFSNCEGRKRPPSPGQKSLLSCCGKRF